jgi:hypothetical protein
VLLVFTVVHKKRSEEPFPMDVFMGQSVMGLQTIMAYGSSGADVTLELTDAEVRGRKASGGVCL